MRRTFLLFFVSSAFAVMAAEPEGAVAPRWLREFEIVAEQFAFEPDRIEVNQGDRVRITVRSADRTHGWEVKALDIDVLARKGGRPETVEFVAERAGSFEITCSEYCGRGHKRMKGVLVVNPGGRS